jgi:hypothetical protein
MVSAIAVFRSAGKGDVRRVGLQWAEGASEAIIGAAYRAVDRFK